MQKGLFCKKEICESDNLQNDHLPKCTFAKMLICQNANLLKCKFAKMLHCKKLLAKMRLQDVSLQDVTVPEKEPLKMCIECLLGNDNNNIFVKIEKKN